MERLKVLSGALLLTLTVLGTFAFTTGKYHPAVNVQCFRFTPATPDGSNVLVQANYTTANPTDGCVTPRNEYCAVCFDIDAHPTYVTTTGGVTKLNTSNSSVSTAIGNKWSAIIEGQTENGITFHYRP